MSELFLGALVSLIVTTIVTESYLFGPVRSVAHRVNRHLGVLFNCYLCFGTWVGWAVAFVVGGPLAHWVLSGLAYHALSYLMHVLVELVDDIMTYLQR